MISSSDTSYAQRPGKYISSSAEAAQEVCRAHDTTTTTVEHVSVYHRRTDVAMSEEFLDSADIISGFQEIGRKGMPQCMAIGWLGDVGLVDSGVHGPLQDQFGHMVPPDSACTRVARQS